VKKGNEMLRKKNVKFQCTLKTGVVAWVKVYCFIFQRDLI